MTYHPAKAANLNRVMRDVREWEAGNLPGNPVFQYPCDSYDPNEDRLIARLDVIKIQRAILLAGTTLIAMVLIAAFGRALPGWIEQFSAWWAL